MKRSEALILIANQLDFLNSKFEGYKTNFTKQELSNANVILTTLEQAGFNPPNITLEQLIPDSSLKVTTETHYFACWEPEDEEK